MTDQPTAPATPAVVTEGALPEQLGVLVRYGAVMLSGWLVRRGYMTDNETPLFTGFFIAAVTAGYALYRAQRNKALLVRVAEAAPNRVAVVVKKDTAIGDIL